MEKYDKSFPVGKEDRYRLMTVLQGMIARCHRPTSVSYKKYGARGISVCPLWYDRENNKAHNREFILWAHKAGYKVGLNIDRIDNNGNYEPENCRFITPKENQRNRRDNVFVTVNGDTRCISEWGEKLGLGEGTIRNRIKNGWSHKDAVSLPVYEGIVYNGERKLIVEWANKFGLPEKTVYARLKNGWSVEKALETPLGVGNSKQITYNGETHSVSEWARIKGLNPETLFARMRGGMNFEEAIETPFGKDWCRFLTWNGKTKRASDWSKMVGIPTNVILTRIRVLGWDVEKALTTPPRKLTKRRNKHGSSTDI